MALFDLGRNSSVIGHMFNKQLEEISGYVDLGLWQEANDLIEELSPDPELNALWDGFMG